MRLMIQIAYFRDVGGRGRYLGKRKEICTKKKPKQAIAWVSGVGGWCSITGTTWQGCLITNPSIFQCHFMEVGERYCDWYKIKNKMGSKLNSWKACINSQDIYLRPQRLLFFLSVCSPVRDNVSRRVEWVSGISQLIRDDVHIIHVQGDVESKDALSP